MPLAVDTSTPKRQHGAPGVEVAGEHTRAARAADQAGQLGLVGAAVLLDGMTHVRYGEDARRRDARNEAQAARIARQEEGER
jgi:hypothetical protein